MHPSPLPLLVWGSDVGSRDASRPYTEREEEAYSEHDDGRPYSLWESLKGSVASWWRSK